jgi:histidinol-phosphatase
MSMPDLKLRYELALAAAREAGQLALGYFHSDSLAVEQKADSSPVTVADRRAEELLRERIAARFPDDAILGEEFGEQSGTSGFRWIVDPIDGTKSFVVCRCLGPSSGLSNKSAA